MELAHLIIFLMALLVAAVLAEPLAQRLHLPFSAVLVLAGFVGSELLVRLAGADTGLRWEIFHDVIMFILLPVLIFESALNLNVRLLLRNLVPTLALAIPLMLLSAGITAVLLFYGIAQPGGFPWIAALLTGALLSATDPVAVLDLFRKADAPERLAVLVDGESLFNDATAIVLFSLLLSMALHEGGAMTWGGGVQQFLITFFGGLLVGVVLGGLAALLVGRGLRPVPAGIISLISAYVAFLVAQEGLHVSGIMAVLATGIWIGWANRRHAASASSQFLHQLWEFNAYIGNGIIFLLVGMTVTVQMFTDRWLAMLIGIGAVIAARAVGIFAFVPLISRLPGCEPIGAGYRAVMFWGGLRGAVALALALSLPLELDYWYTIQSIAYGVVLFTLFVQAPTMPLLMKKVSLD